MARLPNVDGPSLASTVRRQRELLRKQGTASPFSATGQGAVGYVDAGDAAARAYADTGDAAVRSYADTGDASTLASAKSYTDAATAMPGLEAPYAALTIPAAAVTAVPWGAPTENTGGFVVSANSITVPAGKGGVYAISVTLSVANSQPTRGFINLYAGSSRLASREIFTGDSICTATITARVADLGIIKAEIYCATATSLNGGWVTAYRLHS